jgi:hypothetical protein
MAFRILGLSLLIANISFAQNTLRTNDSQQFLNASAARNYIRNSGAEKNILNVTDASLSLTRTTTAPLEGQASFEFNPALATEKIV